VTADLDLLGAADDDVGCEHGDLDGQRAQVGGVEGREARVARRRGGGHLAHDLPQRPPALDGPDAAAQLSGHVQRHECRRRGGQRRRRGACARRGGRRVLVAAVDRPAHRAARVCEQ
jgi:hypothetical protein